MLLRFISSMDGQELTAILSVLFAVSFASIGRVSAQEETSGEIRSQESLETSGVDSESGGVSDEKELSSNEELSSTDGKQRSESNDLEEQGLPSEPSWIQEGDYADAERSVDYRLIEAGGHSELSECEMDFEREMIQVAKKYVDEISQAPGVWNKLNLTPKELQKYLVPGRDYVKEHENEFGTAYLKYGQFAFDGTFRDRVMQVYRESLQRERVSYWGLGLGCLIGGLALVSWVLKRRT